MNKQLAISFILFSILLGILGHQHAVAKEINSNLVHDHWVIPTDTSLKQILDQWSTQAGWQLVWDVEEDFRIRTHYSAHGSFVDVVTKLMRHVYQSNPQLTTTIFYGNRVLLISYSKFVGVG